MNNCYVYDWETFPNYACVTFLNFNSEEKKVFEFHGNETDVEEVSKLRRFLSKRHVPNSLEKGFWLFGYNNLGFDNPLMINLLESKGKNFYSNIPYFIKLHADELIADTNGWKNLSCETKYFLSADIYRILRLHETKTPLKHCGVMIKWPNILDNPFNHYDKISDQDKSKVLEYNLEDCKLTKELFKRKIEELRFNFKLTKLYNSDFINLDSSKLGVKIAGNLYRDRNGLNKYAHKEGTKRDVIHYKDCISEKIKFQTAPFNELLQNLKSKSKSGLENFKDKKEIFFVGNNKFTIGGGGLHTKDNPGVFKSTEDLDIIDADVTTFYLQNMCNLKIKPAHLNDSFFSIIEDDIIKGRNEAKRTGLTLKAAILKIAGVSIFGNMEKEYGIFGDLQAFLSVTLNGQLIILMLVERLLLANFEIISANTDGVTCYVPKSRNSEYLTVCKEWMDETKLNLEYESFDLMCKRDVNSYFGVKSKGGVKRKGWFLTDVNEKSLDKSSDMPIIAMAVENFFAKGIPAEKTIREHKDIFDFCGSQKASSEFKMYYSYFDEGLNRIIETPVQKTCRYFVSNTKTSLVKKKNSKIIELVSGKNLMLMNKYDPNINWFDFIDFKYYISEAYKVIEKIKPKNLLF